MDEALRDESRAMAVLGWVFESWRFPAFALCLVLFYKLLLLLMLLLPASGGALGAFAEEFRTWCFGYDPATGRMQPMYVVSMLIEPLVVGGGVLLLWGAPLRDLLRTRPQKLAPAAAAALGVVCAASAAFGGLGSTSLGDGELPFPAEALRTSHAPPAMRLANQDGTPVSLEALRGRVVMVTGVYAACGLSCPMILGQAKRALAHLSPEDRRDVTVVAVTLDPERDDEQRRAQLAKGQGVGAPEFNFLGGDPGAVHRALDDLGIRRERDPRTGVIDHANLFILIDRGGRIAYRFTLGERQERWLQTALGLLLREGHA